MKRMHKTGVYKVSTLLWTGIFALVFFLLASAAQAATLSVSPETGVYTAGQTFTARVLVNTAGDTINAAEGTLSFNPSEVRVLRVSKGSVFSLWTADPSFSNSAGTITFSGGTPSGYKGSSGSVLSITFSARNAGNSSVSFQNGAVLAADGRGTNVLTSMSGGSYTIAAQDVAPEPETIEYIAPANTPARPNITSTTHADPDGWYDGQTAELAWNVPSGVTAVRTLLDGNSGSIPTKVYDTPISSITLENLEEGVQYFHLQFKNSDGWGRVAHYRLAVDTQDPSSFTVSLPEDADLTNPIQVLNVQAEDETSTVQRYLIQVDNGEPYEFIDEHASGTVTLNPLTPGHHTVVIEAFDAAGNSVVDSLSFGILAFDKPTFTEYPAEITEDVIPVIKGITRPDSEVRLTVQKIGADAQTITLMSDAETGEFVYVPEGRFSLGVYEFSAVAIDQHGAQSEMSDVVRIAVQQPGYLRIGNMVVSALSVFVPLLALLVVFAIGIWFLFTRLRNMRRGVTKESAEALSMLQKEFTELRAALHTEVENLRSTRKTKKLTKAETALVDTMEKELADSESKVRKEIKDVEDIVE